MAEGEVKIKGRVVAILVVTGVLLASVIILFPLVGIYKAELIPYINDPFAVGNLQADVPWSIAECVWGLVYLAGIITGVVFMRKHFMRGLLTLCVVHIFIIQVAVSHFTPKIEAYSQRAAIEFFKSLAGKDVYVHVLGYKSYADLYYTKKVKPTNLNAYNEEWLLNGNVDKPTYFVAKVTNAEPYRALPQLTDLGTKNGFVFFK